MATEAFTPMASVPLEIERFDKDWGVGLSGLTPNPSPFPRINAILRETPKATNGEVVPHRAMILTEVHKQFAGYPQIIKCAQGVAAVLRRTPIYIYDTELLVGTLGCDKQAAQVFPEFGLDWLLDEMENGLLGYSEKRTHDYFTYSDDTYKQLKSIQNFWKDKCIENVAVPLMEHDAIKGSHMGAKPVYLAAAYIYSGAGHTGLNYDVLFHKGYGGIKKDLQERMSALDMSCPDAIRKMTFYKAALIMTEAATDYILRYALLAREKAAAADTTRRAELEKIAATCEWISTNPPRTFGEALQLLHLANLIVLMESSGHSISYGRFDQFMYPYYLRDIKNGIASRADMQELIENFYIKIWEMNKVRDHVSINIFSNGSVGGWALTVGGVKRDGRDGTNDLTFMVLDATAHTRIPAPWTAVRLHSSTPWELKVKVANLIKLGTGEPKIFNDDITIPAMIADGRSLGDSRDYQVVGCVEPDTTGKEYGWHDAAYMNINKVLELAINDGKCIECSEACSAYKACAGAGKQLGIKTGSLAEFKSFDEVIAAYDKQMKHWCDNLVSMLNCIDIAHQAVKPLPYLSALIEGCVESGTDVTQGGAKYNFSGPQAVGIGSVADGLATIKQLVFEEKKIDGAGLLKAVKDNWSGHEALYAYINSDRVHHYGNDDDYADEMAKIGLEAFCTHIQGRPTAHGGHFVPGAYSVAINVACGQLQYASVEGREAYEPVSDCMGAVHTHCCSHDTKGPTAICKSVTKLDHGRVGNGTLLNWKFSPSALAGETGRDNFIALVDTFIQRKGMHSQFTVVSRDTLLAAQKDPEKYRGTLVRVAGYSAFFTQLSKELQDDIIGRTELSFD